ncbi:MAG: transposase [Muribaculaceae bacterium]|nr:transposase [Muribaculaceae bacterium]
MASDRLSLLFLQCCKVARWHCSGMLNTIRLEMSNARIETTNNKIKLIIRRANGFWNIQNMLDMVNLICSDLKVPLLNRKSKTA